MHWRKSPQSIECPSFRSDSMSVTAHSTPNIALIKYWGNRNNTLRLPAADSLSMTLDSPHVEITIDASDDFSVHSFDAKGLEKTLKEKELARLQQHFALTRQYLGALGMPDA